MSVWIAKILFLKISFAWEAEESKYWVENPYCKMSDIKGWIICLSELSQLNIIGLFCSKLDLGKG